MNHALLPSIRDASLPVKYEAARLALAECNRIDECKEWADKTAALASYAKQADNKELEMTAMRIRARAIRRCGELLREVEKGHGKNQNITTGTDSKVLTRKDAARDAGMSERQLATAIQVANVDGESFEEQVESDDPPTITALAEQGKGQGIPIYIRQGMTKEAFQAGMHFQSRLTYFVKEVQEFDPQEVADGSTAEERDEIRRNIESLDRYFGTLITKI